MKKHWRVFALLLALLSIPFLFWDQHAARPLESAEENSIPAGPAPARSRIASAIETRDLPPQQELATRSPLPPQDVPKFAVHGKLLLESGQPSAFLEDASIFVFEASQNEPDERAVATTWTGLQGDYRLELAPGRYRARAQLRGSRLRKALFPKNFELRAGENLEQDLQWVLPLGQIRGRVVDCHGVPVPGVILEESAPSQEDGSFELLGLEPETDTPVRIRESSLPKGMLLPWWQTGSFSPREGEGSFFSVDKKLQTRRSFWIGQGNLVEVIIPRKSFFGGTATLGNGVPAHGTLSFSLTEHPHGGFGFHTSSDERGGFRVDNPPPGKYRVAFSNDRHPSMASAHSDSYPPTPLEFEIGCGEWQTDARLLFDKGVGTGSVHCRIEDLLGNPIPWISFSISKITETREYETTPAIPFCFSDARGEFSFDGLPDGEFVIRRPKTIPAPESNLLLDGRGTPLRFSIRNGETVEGLVWQVEVVPSASIRGTIRGLPSNLPSGEWRLEVHRRESGLQRFSFEVNRSGEFRIDSACPGKARIVFERARSGKLLWETNLTLLPGKNPSLDLIWENE